MSVSLSAETVNDHNRVMADAMEVSPLPVYFRLQITLTSSSGQCYGSFAGARYPHYTIHIRIIRYIYFSRKLLTPSPPSTRLPSHLSHLCVCSRPGHPAKTRSQIRPSRSSGPRHADSQVACDELDLKLRLTKAIVLVAAVVAVLALPVCMCARAETREQENAAPAAKRAHQHQRGSPSRSQLLLLCMAHHP